MKRLVFGVWCLVFGGLWMVDGGWCENASAVPAWPGPHTRTLADGTTQTYYVHGDEFYHWETATPEATLTEEQQVHRAAALQQAAHRMPAELGEPYLPQKGLVILANFKDVKFKNSRDQMDSLCNATDYTYNGAYKSAAQYFKDQSNGKYCPIFDVVGPVELDSCYAYYGKNDGNGNDRYIGDVVIEACRKAKKQYPTLNFANYAKQNPGQVDFVFIIYAGYGENETYDDDHNRLWPMQWNLDYTYSRYISPRFTRDSAKIDGVKINMFAYTNELQYSDDSRCGIGTLCHEFGHVLGLADLYNTVGDDYYTNLPNNWHIMCLGCYNDKGNRPPSYSPFDKFFFGWEKPTLLQDNQTLALPADGKTYAYMTEHNTAWNTPTQFNDSTVYYFENRQQTGWDTCTRNLNGHGLLVWRVKFNKTTWKNSGVNNDKSALRMTVIPSSGSGTVSNNNSDTYPGSGEVKTITPFPNRAAISIEEKDGVITLNPISEPTAFPTPLPLYSPTSKKYLLNNQIIIVDEKNTFDISSGSLLRSSK